MLAAAVAIGGVVLADGRLRHGAATGATDAGAIVFEERDSLERKSVSDSSPSASSDDGSPPSGATERSWFSVVKERIANDEHRFVDDERSPGVFLAHNRNQDYDVRLDHEGIEVRGRIGTATFSWSYRLAGVGRPGNLSPVAETSPVLGTCSLRSRVGTDGTCLERVEVHRDGVVEHYDNLSAGMQHGVLVERSPPGEGPLVLAGLVGGGLFGRVSDDGDAVFYDDRRDLLRYGGLRVEDAAGRELDSWLEARDSSLDIVVDDSGAVYPLHVDPIMESASEDLGPDSGGTGEGFGFSVAGAGDVNGDGAGDVLIGAPFFSSPGMSEDGRVYLFFGSFAGLSVLPWWYGTPGQTKVHYGHAIASGDVNGDGCSDIIIGAPLYDDMYSDGGAGLLSGAVWSKVGFQPGDQFGYSVAGAGDVGGDGYADVIIGVPYYDNGRRTDAGRALIMHGSASGLGSPVDTILDGAEKGAELGRSVAGAGDVNGDGYADVIVAEPLADGSGVDKGRAAAWFGRLGGIPSGVVPDWETEGVADFDEFGHVVASGGDVEGDGYDEVIVGAPEVNNRDGSAHIYHGYPSGLRDVATWTRGGAASKDSLGTSVASAGDVDGDGYDDILVAAPGYDPPGLPNAGRVYLYRGAPLGLPSTAIWTADGFAAGAKLGASVAGAGDVDGDGYEDVIIGAPAMSGGAGAAQLNRMEIYSERGRLLQIGMPGPQDPETWDGLGVSHPWVTADADGGFQMWYVGSDGANDRIGMASTSESDLVTAAPRFFRDGIALNLGTPGSWDATHVSSPTMVLDEAPWRMYYAGSDGATWRIGLAEAACAP